MATFEEIPEPGEESNDPTVQSAREVLNTADENEQERLISGLKAELRGLEEKEAGGEIGEMLEFFRDDAWMNEAYEELRKNRSWTVSNFWIRKQALEAALVQVANSIHGLMQGKKSTNLKLEFNVNKNLSAAIEAALGKEAFLQIAPLYGMAMEDLRGKWSAGAENEESDDGSGSELAE